MFGKKKKRVEISAPSNFEHRVHTGFDQHEQKFTGLPRQWQSLIEESARRPKPLIDPACITSIQPGAPKVAISTPLVAHSPCCQSGPALRWLPVSWQNAPPLKSTGSLPPDRAVLEAHADL